ncbi:MAG: CoA pyrophosphatase [Flavobacteriales bacterium]|nr:CoA pyrophosphatase [Flavobacteriales bacterium]
MILKLEDLIKLPNLPLPGEKAHMEMSPKMRDTAQKIRGQKVSFRESAVLVILYNDGNGLNIPLIERNVYDGTHSGQISFPGGKRESNDPHLEHTALRETKEEIGLEKDDLKVIHQLSDIYIPPSNFMVTPYLAYHENETRFIPDETEVASIIPFPLAALLDDSIIETRKIFVQKYNAHLKVPAYVYQENVIWGATAIILAELKHMIKNLIGQSL